MTINKLIKAKSTYLKAFIDNPVHLGFLLEEIDVYKQNLSGESSNIPVLTGEHLYDDRVSNEIQQRANADDHLYCGQVSIQSQQVASVTVNGQQSEANGNIGPDSHEQTKRANGKRANGKPFNFHLRDFSDLIFVEDNDKNNIEKFANRVSKLKKENNIKNLNNNKGQLQVALGYLAAKYEFIIKEKEDDPTGVDYIKDKALAMMNNQNAYRKRADSDNPDKPRKKKVLNVSAENNEMTHNLNLSN